MMYNLKTYRDREKFFLDLYMSFFPDVAAYIERRGGTLENARDIFQECLVIYYEKITEQQASPVRNEKAYLMGMAKKLWYGMYRDGGKFQKITGQQDIFPGDYADDHMTLSARENILDVLEQTGRRCMNMLKAFYYDKLNMQEMAERFGFGSVRSATVQKYKCLEKVRDKVKEKSLHYEDFTA
ncbi:hypothetical protein LS482_00375 [Sinomicrobium kalidii]|uniref:RNA polymerase sigma factor n=1 Tax=Sinomicrobium kalidii TaxID=2900738 RepID=UPI001E309BC1|nr:sigma-70 family RNA polymerase sigma factor [Sinomicrobium kalidii]UGU16339.1 hypothetical protein LS482_00375 [Sinomicrobium kalidii]